MNIIDRITHYVRGMMVRGLMLLGVMLASTAMGATPLNDQLIDRWLESQSDIQAWAMANRARLEPHESEDGWSDLRSVDNMLHSLKASGLYEEAAGVMARYGFASPEEWADATIRILKAYLANELEGQEERIEQVRAELAAIEANSELPWERKQAMLKVLHGSLAMVELVQTSSQEDRRAVRPHMEKIRNQVGNGER